MIKYFLFPVLVLVLSVAPAFLLGQQITFAPGYQRSCNNLKWSIAGNESGLNPPVLSQLTWNKIKINSYGLAADLTFNRFSLLANYYKSVIDRGTVDDIDYRDNGELLLHKSYSSSSGDGYNLMSGLRYFFYVSRSQKFKVGIEGGYKLCFQNYLITGFTGLDPHLNSSYKTKWSGGYMGFATFIRLQRFQIKTRFESGLYQYSGEGDWNLITEYQHPVSFMHTANKGYAVLGEMIIGYRINKTLEAIIIGSFTQFKVRNGYDYLFYSNGNIAKTRLNEVVDRTRAVRLQLALHL